MGTVTTITTGTMAIITTEVRCRQIEADVIPAKAGIHDTVGECGELHRSPPSRG